MRKLGILAVAGLSSLVLTGVASAADTIAPVPLSFNNAVLGTAAGSLVVASPATAPITATANVDTSNGTFTINPNQISFPNASFTTPVPGTATIALKGPAMGQLNPATGQLGFTADFEATVSVTGLGSCTVDTGPQTYSTDQTNILPGQRFPAGDTGFITGAGAISGGWPSLASTNGAACALLGSALSGSGSLWISRNISPPAKLAMTVVPKAKVTAGKSVKLSVKVANSGIGAAQNVKVCVSVPKVLKAHGPKCVTVATIAASGSATETFTLKALPKAKGGNYKVKFTASTTGAAAPPASETVKVTAKK
jgi:hypothetical protein